MEDLNSVSIVGRLTKDCESKSTQSGTSIIRFSIANNQRKRIEKDWKDVASYFEVVTFGSANLVPYLKKGQQVAITGKLSQRTWEKDGQKQSRVEIIADRLQMLGGKQEGSKPAGPESFEDDDYPDF